MKEKVLLVESPKKAKQIQGILGAGWAVFATKGHILDLPTNEMGVHPPHFKPHYEPIDAARLRKLKSDVAGASEIYIGTDPDREGEAIAAHVAKVLSLSPAQAKRVRFNAINAKEIRAAVAAPSPIDYNRVAAQEGRRVLDRLVGYMVSPKLMDQVGRPGGKTLSAGRVQSPAVRLVVEREWAIRNFKKNSYYEVELHFEDAASSRVWHAMWMASPLLEAGQRHCLDKNLADDVAATSPVQVSSVETVIEQHAPPAPLKTSALQAIATTRLKMRPQETMAAAQELYDRGFISYHRTDNPNLDDETIDAVRGWLKANGFADKIAKTPQRWKVPTNAQEAHPACSPKDLDASLPADLSPAARALYPLIWQYAVASQMAPEKREVKIATLTGTTPAQRDAQFIAKSSIQIDPGWRALTGISENGEDSEGEEGEGAAASGWFPERLASGEVLTPESGDVLAKSTRPSPRYTEASLIRELEAKGIGRPATYASIMSTISERGYTTLNKKRQLESTPLGELLIIMLVPTFRFIDYQFTSTVETYLDRIAAGEAKYEPMMQNMHALLVQEIANLKPPAPHEVPEALRGKLSTADQTVYQCPSCNVGELRRIDRGKGKGAFWGCNRYNRDHPEMGCKHVQPDVDGKPGQRSAIAARSR